MRGVVVAVLAGALSAGCSVLGIRTTEEPPYTVERHIAGAEIRRYGARLAADTVVSASEMQARRTGFERLAGYIFGANAGSERIAMTAPVAQLKEAPDVWRIRFFMPAEARPGTLPAPRNAAIALVHVPGELVAVWRYSGSASRAAVKAAETSLLQAAAQAGLQTEGPVFSWFYDPPWTLPPLRRNEAVVRLIEG